MGAVPCRSRFPPAPRAAVEALAARLALGICAVLGDGAADVLVVGAHRRGAGMAAAAGLLVVAYRPLTLDQALDLWQHCDESAALLDAEPPLRLPAPPGVERAAAVCCKGDGGFALVVDLCHPPLAWHALVHLTGPASFLASLAARNPSAPAVFPDTRGLLDSPAAMSVVDEAAVFSYLNTPEIAPSMRF